MVSLVGRAVRTLALWSNVRWNVLLKRFIDWLGVGERALLLMAIVYTLKRLAERVAAKLYAWSS